MAMSEYYLREIVYELYGIADVLTKGKSVAIRATRHAEEMKRLDALNLALIESMKKQEEREKRYCKPE